MATHPQPRPIFHSQGSFEDLDAVMEVMDTAFSPAFGEAWSRSQCAGILPMNGVRLTVAHDGSPAGRVVGFALHRTVSDEAELLLLAVRPEDQGRGIGHGLVDAFVAGAYSQGARRLHLEVRDGNPATHLYAHAGFQVAGRRRAYYRGTDGVRHDALTFARTLD
ncbi:GNAT family N-acetyltransferase [Sphingomicrobium nitratireducens]|uniref:GNAT family N-acetyltransferase n=1 Tax=Sphingomicrobium nitratireducens TaxID=2964666 RepID=UPI002240D11A|nr:GNAT family N-acetyltransferase [Sphingomicrobium nitratireducens]